MYLIFGGAYQGKREFARQRFGLAEEDFWYCGPDAKGGAGEFDSRGDVDAGRPDLTKRAICGLEYFALDCVRSGAEAADWLRAHRQALEGKIVICTDLSQGVVPVEAELRAWREMCGRMMIYLAAEAEEVYRIFCGIPQKLK